MRTRLRNLWDLPIKEGPYLDDRDTKPFFTSYDPLGPFMNFEKMGVLDWGSVSVDEVGIPRLIYYGRPEYYPVTVLHLALELANKHFYAPGDAEIERRFFQLIDWTLDHQDEHGGWPTPYDHNFFEPRTELTRTPWYSCLTQGLAISLLVRLAHWKGADMRERIMRAAAVMTRDVAHHGTAARVMGVKVYEEYPTDPPSAVLNGMIYGLIGLYDGWTLLGDPVLKQALDAGLDSVETLLPLYDLGDGTAYDLTHITSRVNGPNRARWKYHRLHVELLSILEMIRPGLFGIFAERWEMYLRGNRLREN